MILSVTGRWVRRSARPVAVATCALAVIAGSAGPAVAAGSQAGGGGAVTIRCGNVAGLVAAITRANARRGKATTINLARGCRYVLKKPASGMNGLPTVRSRITVSGDGAWLVRSGAKGTPAFRIWAVSKKGTLVLRRLTVAGGSAPGAGGILNRGTLRLYQADVTSNTATGQGDTEGGGIDSTGTLVIVASQVDHNLAVSRTGVAAGGGIENTGNARLYASSVDHNAVRSSGDSAVGGGVDNGFTGTLTVSFSQLSTNFATSPTFVGGVALSNAGTATLNSTWVTGNAGVSAGTGRAAVQTVGPRLTIAASVVSGNTVRGQGVVGGGVYTGGGLRVTTSIITGNTADNTAKKPNLAAEGGGIFAGGGSNTLTDSVVTRNRAVNNGTGGGIFLAGAAKLTLTRTLVAVNSPDNCAPAGSIRGCRR